MISHLKLHQSLQHYISEGFTLKETPWYVSENILALTCPKGIDLYKQPSLNGLYHVASGEQSFLELYFKGELEKQGAFITLTPCVRQEPVINEYNQDYFMKTELIVINPQDPYEALKNVMICAKLFFNAFLPVELVQLEDHTLSVDGVCFDLVSKEGGIELGSYGLRQYKDLVWVYGTGCAEPRLSVVVDKYGKTENT